MVKRTPPRRRRPALRAALFYAAGLLAADLTPPDRGWMMLAAAVMWVGGLSLVVARVRRDRLTTVILALCLGACGFVRGKAALETPGRRLALRLRTESVEGFEGVTVGEPEHLDSAARVEVRLEAVKVEGVYRPGRGKVLLRVGDRVAVPSYGTRIRVEAPVRAPDAARNPGAFDYAEYLGRRGIGGLVSVRKPENLAVMSTGYGTPLWDYLVLPVRRHIRITVDGNLTGGAAGLLKGILLGEKRSVPDGVRAAFTRAGVNHVLAVSGLHVGLIAGVIFFGLRSIGAGRRVTGATTAVGLALYALVTGMPPSVIRAALTAAVLIRGSLSGREGDSLNALGFAAILILMWRPGDLYELGFQLSFAATSAILLLHSPIRRLMPVGDGHPVGKWVAGPLAVSLAAQAGTVPMVVQTFGVMSLVAPVANLVVVPIVAAGAALGLVTVIVAAAVPAVATILNAANWLLLTGAIEAARLFAMPEWAQVSVAVLPAPLVLLYVSLLALCVPEIRTRRLGAYVIMVGLGAANIWVWGPMWRRDDAVTVTFLDVGQGDGIFVEFPNGRTMLVDAGLRAPGVDMGDRVILPYLRTQGIRRVDVLVASHPHADHTGGLVRVLEAVEVGTYLDGGQHYGSWTARRIRELLRIQGVSYTSVAAGDSLLGLGGAGITVLHPGPEWVSGELKAPHGMNNGSVVMRLDFGATRLLLTGDVEQETDAALLRWRDGLRADILKAAHHGSRTSSSIAFLRGVSPEQVIVSCGVRNKFRHPSPEVVERYRDLGLRVDRTDHHGAIRVRISEDGVETVRWLERGGVAGI